VETPRDDHATPSASWVTAALHSSPPDTRVERVQFFCATEANCDIVPLKLKSALGELNIPVESDEYAGGRKGNARSLPE